MLLGYFGKRGNDMLLSVKIAPPHSLITISDSQGGEVPDSVSKNLITSTRTCISVGTKAEIDGETEIIIGNFDEINLDSDPSFYGEIATPSRVISVFTVFEDQVLFLETKTKHASVQIWVNDQNEPTKIVIGIK